MHPAETTARAVAKNFTESTNQTVSAFFGDTTPEGIRRALNELEMAESARRLHSWPFDRAAQRQLICEAKKLLAKAK
jgi:hypothetical protein